MIEALTEHLRGLGYDAQFVPDSDVANATVLLEHRGYTVEIELSDDGRTVALMHYAGGLPRIELANPNSLQIIEDYLAGMDFDRS